MSIERVWNTTRYPYSAAVSVSVVWDDGGRSRGSGVMVGRNDVVTAAHVVYDPHRSARRITVTAGLNGFEEPFGRTSAGRINYYAIRIDGGLISETAAARDIAVIGLREALGDSTGWMGVAAGSGSGLRNLIHYPGAYARPDGYLPQMRSTGQVALDRRTGALDISSLGVSGGSSGGGVYRFSDGERHVVGAVSTRTWASYVDNAVFADLRRWMAGNDDLLNDGGSAPIATPAREKIRLGALDRVKIRRRTLDYVANRHDDHVFRVSRRTQIVVRLSDLRNDADVMLFDRRGDLVGGSSRPGAAAERFRRTLAPGRYRITVSQRDAGDNAYALRVAPRSPVPLPEGYMRRDVGVLTGTTRRRAALDSVANPGDRVIFALTTRTRLVVRLSNLRSDADIHLHDGAGRRIAASVRAGTRNDRIARTLGPGEYHVDVRQFSPGRNRYALALIPRSLDGGAVAAARVHHLARPGVAATAPPGLA